MAFVNGTNNSETINALDGVTAGADEIYGQNGNDTIYGLGGDDKIDGGSGADLMIGGAGNDVYYVDNSGDVVSEGGGRYEGVDWVYASIDYTLPTYVENLVLDGSSEIDGTGNGSANAIYGNSKNNILKGLGGNDSLYGNGGNDTLIGGTGDDRLDGGSGADKMSGGTGNDTYYVDSAFDTVSENVGEGTEDTVKSYIEGYSLGANVENLWLVGVTTGSGNALDNEIHGNELDNLLTGYGGNDVFWAEGGNDTMIGGTGDDRYHLTEAGDVAIENANEGNRIGSSTLFSDTLPDNFENLVLLGTDNLNGTGNAVHNYLRGTTGDNILDGAGGLDWFEGLTGNDTYYLDTLGEEIIELAGEGTDWTYVSFSNYVLDDNVENGSVFTNAGIRLNGNVLDNDLYGAGGSDKLVGGGGKDFLGGGESGDDLYGSSGDDTLSGDNGHDYINGGLDNDTLSGGFGYDHFVFINGDGHDTITDFVAGDLNGDTSSSQAMASAASPSFSNI